MAESLYVRKVGKTLFEAANDPVSLEVAETFDLAAFYRAQITRPRNYRFHRKLFALFRLAFDAWEPGIQGHRQFEKFWKDILILAGFRRQYVSLLDQEIRFEAESIAFASMSEGRFRQLYKAVLDTLWDQIYRLNPHYSRADLDRLAEQILHFE